MRGKHSFRPSRSGGSASTPAYAGQTHCPSMSSPPGSLYPRICGANRELRISRSRSVPLPPHMRGKRPRSTTCPAAPTLYPRICGANSAGVAGAWNIAPLPPHMRGKQRPSRPLRPGEPSTPAYAGQTEFALKRVVRSHLYPRICGANNHRIRSKPAESPLPPHMRGKHRRQRHAFRRAASTPAYAGQTLVEPRNSAEAYSPITRFSFTASPPASSGTRHTPSKTTGPATTSSKTTVR